MQLPVALWYGAPAQFYALLGAMLLAIGVDLVPFPRQHSRADDYVTSAVMLVCCFVLFWKASIGYFSVFFLLIYCSAMCSSWASRAVPPSVCWG